MTLGKHKISGLQFKGIRPLPTNNFEKLMFDAGYLITGSSSAFNGRFYVWFTHASFERVEAIYSPDRSMVITAYHVKD